MPGTTPGSVPSSLFLSHINCIIHFHCRVFSCLSVVSSLLLLCRILLRLHCYHGSSLLLIHISTADKCLGYVSYSLLPSTSCVPLSCLFFQLVFPEGADIFQGDFCLASMFLYSLSMRCYILELLYLGDFSVGIFFSIFYVLGILYSTLYYNYFHY